MISKRAGLLDANVIKMILAVGAVFLLVWLLVNLFVYTYDRNNESSKAYFEKFELAIKETNSGESNFYILDDGDEETEFYLVYFGGFLSFVSNVGGEDREFLHQKKGENDVCICHLQGSLVRCNYCMDVGMRVEYTSKDGYKNIQQFVIGEGKRVNIIKKGDGYAFVEF